MQELESSLRKVVDSWEGAPWWRDGFYAYSMSTPAHTFYTYAGIVEHAAILLTLFRDDPAEELAKTLIDEARRHCPIDPSTFIYQKQPLVHTRFDSILLLPPAYNQRFTHHAPELTRHTIECTPVFDCEFSGTESAQEYHEFQRYISTIVTNREPNPQCAVKCSIPIADLQIPQWHTCPYSELESYLFVLSGHRDGVFSVRNISGSILNVDPAGDYEANKEVVRRHVTCI